MNRTGQQFRLFKDLPLAFVLALCAADFSFAGQEGETAKPKTKNEVVVMGMVHSRHLNSKSYSVDRIKEIVKRFNPDYVLCEIPPDRFEAGISEFRKTGKVTEARIKRFPEYVDAVFPLSKTMKFEIVPCAAWTQSMAEDRREKMQQYAQQRSKEYQEMAALESRMNQKMQEEGMDDDPAKIHTERYDELVKESVKLYEQYFSADLGPGGWHNINTAHYALITRALGEHKYEGKKILIMFGAGHKYWFKEKLRERDDIDLKNINDYLED